MLARPVDPVDALVLDARPFVDPAEVFGPPPVPSLEPVLEAKPPVDEPDDTAVLVVDPEGPLVVPEV